MRPRSAHGPAHAAAIPAHLPFRVPVGAVSAVGVIQTSGTVDRGAQAEFRHAARPHEVQAAFPYIA